MMNEEKPRHNAKATIGADTNTIFFIFSPIILCYLLQRYSHYARNERRKWVKRENHESNQRLTVATLSLLTMISVLGKPAMWMRILPRK